MLTVPIRNYGCRIYLHLYAMSVYRNLSAITNTIPICFCLHYGRNRYWQFLFVITDIVSICIYTQCRSIEFVCTTVKIPICFCLHFVRIRCWRYLFVITDAVFICICTQCRSIGICLQLRLRFLMFLSALCSQQILTVLIRNYGYHIYLHLIHSYKSTLRTDADKYGIRNYE